MDIVERGTGHVMTCTHNSSHYIPAALLINTQCNYHISCMIDVTCMCNVCTYVHSTIFTVWEQWVRAESFSLS